MGACRAGAHDLLSGAVDAVDPAGRVEAARFVPGEVGWQDSARRRVLGTLTRRERVRVEGVVDRAADTDVIERRDAGVEEEVLGVEGRTEVKLGRVLGRELDDLLLRQRGALSQRA